jgi:photosystem II cytochrome c550
MLKFTGWRWLWIAFLIVVSLLSSSNGASAEVVDAYVSRYLRATEPITLPFNAEGESHAFTAADLSAGKRLFETNCVSCHVGGATLPNPLVSLSLEDLKGATPPRDTIQSLVDFQREPRTYDGQDFGFGCREVPEAFVLRAAAVAPGWGTDRF